MDKETRVKKFVQEFVADFSTADQKDINYDQTTKDILDIFARFDKKKEGAADEKDKLVNEFIGQLIDDHCRFNKKYVNRDELIKDIYKLLKEPDNDPDYEKYPEKINMFLSWKIRDMLIDCRELDPNDSRDWYIEDDLKKFLKKVHGFDYYDILSGFRDFFCKPDTDDE